MPLFRRTRMTKLLRHLQAVDAGLRMLTIDKTIIPSPAEMLALEQIQVLLRALPHQVELLEHDAWRRIRQWQQTPWTPWQCRLQNIAVFFGWWLAGSMTILQCILGWVIPLFPAPWMVMPASAGTALAIMCAFTICDRRARHNNGSPAELSRVPEGNTEEQLLRL